MHSGSESSLTWRKKQGCSFINVTAKDQAPRFRAYDKVQVYLQEQLKVHEETENVRLPSIREISRAAGVSPSSARNVLLDLAKQKRVEILPGTGAFWIPEVQRKKDELVIGVNRASSGPLGAFAKQWWYKLYGGMVRSAIKAGVELRFRPFIFEVSHAKQVDLSELKKSVEGIDGCFLFYPYEDTLRVADFLEKHSIPCFFYNPLTPTRTTNFLSPDYFGTARRIGEVWRQTGRKRIMMFQAPGVRKSTSCQLLYAGMVSGLALADERLPEVYRVDVAENLRSHGSEAFKAFVKRTQVIPDAVHCTADALAQGVFDAAEELGIDIPTQMSLIGGNGMSRNEAQGEPPLLTATEQPVEQIGENFIRLFQKRTANQSRDVPGVYYPMRLLIGQTTRPQENELLAEPV